MARGTAAAADFEIAGRLGGFLLALLLDFDAALGFDSAGFLLTGAGLRALADLFDVAVGFDSGRFTAAGLPTLRSFAALGAVFLATLFFVTGFARAGLALTGLRLATDFAADLATGLAALAAFFATLLVDFLLAGLLRGFAGADFFATLLDVTGFLRAAAGLAALLALPAFLLAVFALGFFFATAFGGLPLLAADLPVRVLAMVIPLAWR